MRFRQRCNSSSSGIETETSSGASSCGARPPELCPGSEGGAAVSGFQRQTSGVIQTPAGWSRGMILVLACEKSRVQILVEPHFLFFRHPQFSG